MTCVLLNLFLIRTKKFCLQYFVLYIMWNTSVKCSTFSDITNTVFESGTSGIIAAFGDFNSDKITDLFRIVNNNKTVDVLIGFQTEPLLRSTLTCSFKDKAVINAVMPGDFNGDSMMDLLVIVQTPGIHETSEVRILWGSLRNLSCSGHTHFKVKTQPLLLDYNGDMIPDLFGEDENGTRTFWIAQKSGEFVRKDAPIGVAEQSFSVPHSCSFTDLDFDGVADLFITGAKKIEYWLHESGHFGFPKNETFDYPKNMAVQGQSMFVDLNTDGTLEHILPICHDRKCTSCSVMVRSLNDSEWHVLVDKFVYKEEKWCFFFRDNFPVSLRSGDFNIDGYPDFVVVLRNQSESQSGAVLLKNVECSSCPLGRKLEPIWDLVEYANLRSVQLVAFYDFFNDGILDLLMTTQEDAKYKIHAIQNINSIDAYFIKIIVIGGLCQACSDGHAAYGTNQPGPYIKYMTIKSDSSFQMGSATQLYQSAHFSLQLPYIVFGLAQTTNFVDRLQVTIPGSNRTTAGQRTWTQLIPNSQMVVIPYPPENSRYWLNKLFVTPSHLVLMTLAALVGTCLFIGLIIGALYWKERREDRREKLLEAHRFHFDAM